MNAGLYVVCGGGALLCFMFYRYINRRYNDVAGQICSDAIDGLASLSGITCPAFTFEHGACAAPLETEELLGMLRNKKTVQELARLLRNNAVNYCEAELGMFLGSAIVLIRGDNIFGRRFLLVIDPIEEKIHTNGAWLDLDGRGRLNIR